MNVIQVNYLGTVLLTLLLLDHFNENESKIISISSIEYKRSKLTYGDSKCLISYDLIYNYFSQALNKQAIYSETKLLLNYFTRYLAQLT